MSSTAKWGSKPAQQQPSTPDEFVTGRESLSRMNFLMPTDLHVRIKVTCAEQGRSMRTVLIEILEEHFPARENRTAGGRGNSKSTGSKTHGKNT